MLCVVVLSGDIRDKTKACEMLDRADRIISADGGSRHLKSLGILPDYALGDFDSIDPDAMAWLKENGIPIEMYPQKKDQTDSELAVDFVLGLLNLPASQHEIVLLAAFGDRPDHVLSNQLMAAEHAKTGWRFMLTDGRSVIYTLVGGQMLTLDLPADDRHPLALSTMAVGGAAAGLTYAGGLLYPLTNKKLMPGSTLGISNRVTGSPVIIRLETGVCLVFITPEI